MQSESQRVLYCLRALLNNNETRNETDRRSARCSPVRLTNAATHASWPHAVRAHAHHHRAASRTAPRLHVDDAQRHQPGAHARTRCCSRRFAPRPPQRAPRAALHTITDALAHTARRTDPPTTRRRAREKLGRESKSSVRCCFRGVMPWYLSLRRPCLPRTPMYP